MITENGSKLTFQEELENLINRYSQETGSDTPDFILAKYLYECLEAFNTALQRREKHYGRRMGFEERFNDSKIFKLKEE